MDHHSAVSVRVAMGQGPANRPPQARGETRVAHEDLGRGPPFPPQEGRRRAPIAGPPATSARSSGVRAHVRSSRNRRVCRWRMVQVRVWSGKYVMTMLDGQRHGRAARRQGPSQGRRCEVDRVGTRAGDRGPVAERFTNPNESKRDGGRRSPDRRTGSPTPGPQAVTCSETAPRGSRTRPVAHEAWPDQLRRLCFRPEAALLADLDEVVPGTRPRPSDRGQQQHQDAGRGRPGCR